MNNKSIGLAVFFLTLLLSLHAVAAQEPAQYKSAVIFYNDACSMCAMYVQEELIPTLEKTGIENIVIKDYINERKNRVELNNLNRQHNIPPTLQGHFMVFIDDKIILGGHVPEHIIADLLTKNLEIDKILVLQDEMDNAQSYFAWGFKGSAKEYGINTPIKEYVDWFNENKESLESSEQEQESKWVVSVMLPIILSTGFLDGINPCAFGVLLFFILFLYSIRRTKGNIIKIGVIYILAIFLAYFLIGIGIVKAFVFTGNPHIMARISAYLILVLGVLSIANFFFPKATLVPGMPSVTKAYIRQMMQKATMPTAFIVGFLVGLCTFPCSGGIYVAVIGLLAAKTTYLQGMVYLVVYNIMFVMPLVIILAAASNKKITEKVTDWEQSKIRLMRLISGIVMLLLGAAILLWLI